MSLEQPIEKRKLIIRISILFALIFLFFCFDFDEDLKILVEGYIIPPPEPLPFEINSIEDLKIAIEQNLLPPRPPFISSLLVTIDLQYLLCLPLFLFLIRFIFKHPFKEAGLIIDKESWLFIGFCAVYVSLILFLGRTFSFYHTDTVILVAKVITSIFLVGIMEELVFRGFIFNKLIKFVNNKRSFIFAVLISAALFSICHAPMLLNNLSALIQKLVFTFLFGIWAAVYYFYSRNLTGCIVVHGTNNIIFTISGVGYSNIFGILCYYIFWVIVLVFTIIKIRRAQGTCPPLLYPQIKPFR